MDAASEWADRLRGWQIPAPVLDRAADSPWVLPREVFRLRADRRIAAPVGATHHAALQELRTPGTVLDVGAAAGANSLPLAGRAPVTEITAIDTDEELLAAFADRAEAVGVPGEQVHGQWPEVADRVDAADVVLAGNVLYNVADLGPFARALTSHARRRVIAETAVRHPLTELNSLWWRFHGIARPTGPDVDDCLRALAVAGIRPTVTYWSLPPEAEHASFADLVEVTRRRLCLPAGATADVDRALREEGIDPACPPDLGSSGRELATLTWEGSAAAGGRGQGPLP